jgi:hypothetical protein
VVVEQDAGERARSRVPPLSWFRWLVDEVKQWRKMIRQANVEKSLETRASYPDENCCIFAAQRGYLGFSEFFCIELGNVVAILDTLHVAACMALGVCKTGISPQ